VSTLLLSPTFCRRQGFTGRPSGGFGGLAQSPDVDPEFVPFSSFSNPVFHSPFPPFSFPSTLMAKTSGLLLLDPSFV